MSIFEAPVWDKVNHCFCLQVRQSFHSWGFSKVTISTLLLCCFLMPTFNVILSALRHWSLSNVLGALAFILLSACFIADIVLHIIFIVGTNQNSEKKLRVYYMYSKVLLVLSPTLLAVYIFIIRNGFYFYLSFYDTQIEKLLFTVITTISVSFIIQIYITLLVRNEIAKIRKLEFKLLIDDLCRDKLP